MAIPEQYIELFHDLYSLKGQKLRIVTKVGTYDGFLENLSPKSQMVFFRDVLCLKTNLRVGDLRFLLEDFISYKVTELTELEKYPKWDYVTRILQNSYAGGTQFKMSDFFDDFDDPDDDSDESIHYPDEIEEEEFILELPPHLQHKLPLDNVVLDEIDQEYHQAIDYISRQKIIGVAFEGPEISRIGQLTWVCITTPFCTFMFDIKILGEAAFTNGLREIFQAKNIQKVIHDCRKPADCLAHLFSTKLVNVFDTQVADYIGNAQRWRGTTAFKYIKTLDSCLKYHLRVPEEFLFNRVEHFSMAAERNFFSIRPLMNDYRAVLIKNVIYLPLLRETLNELMLNPFRRAVDIHLGVKAQASQLELSLDSSSPNQIAPAMLMHGIETIRYQSIAEAPIIPLVCKFRPPKENMKLELSANSKKELDSQSRISWFDNVPSSSHLSSSKIRFVPAGMGC